MAASKLRIKAVWALSIILLAAGVWDFHFEIYGYALFCLIGFALSLLYCLRGGSLPECVHSEVGIDREGDASHIPLKYAVPVFALLGFGAILLVVWLVFKLLSSDPAF